jgi:hypothetical protein
MSGDANWNEKDQTLPALLPPLIKSLPRSLRRYDPDDPTPRGDQSITLDEEDERILDKVWAEIARHPRMAVDPDAAPPNGVDDRQNGRGGAKGQEHAPERGPQPRDDDSVAGVHTFY